jgi:uncharacterized protein
MRQKYKRKLGYEYRETFFKPRGIPLRELEIVDISDEEIESLRLRFIEKLKQEDAANRMGISQSQYQRDITSAMTKITNAIINGSAISLTKIIPNLDNSD